MRWGIRESNGRYEVYGPRLKFAATCETRLDAETVLACLTQPLTLNLGQLRERMNVFGELIGQPDGLPVMEGEDL